MSMIRMISLRASNLMLSSFFCSITIRKIHWNRTITWLLDLQTQCQSYITFNLSVMEIEQRAMEVLFPFLLVALLPAAMVVNACEVSLTAPEPDQTIFISFTVWKLDVFTSKVVIMLDASKGTKMWQTGTNNDMWATVGVVGRPLCTV